MMQMLDVHALSNLEANTIFFKQWLIQNYSFPFNLSFQTLLAEDTPYAPTTPANSVPGTPVQESIKTPQVAQAAEPHPLQDAVPKGQGGKTIYVPKGMTLRQERFCMIFYCHVFPYLFGTMIFIIDMIWYIIFEYTLQNLKSKKTWLDHSPAVSTSASVQSEAGSNVST